MKYKSYVLIAFLIVVTAIFVVPPAAITSSGILQQAVAQTDPDTATSTTDTSATTTTSSSDSLYISDNGDNTIKVIDTADRTGSVFIPKTDAGQNYVLKGPKGVIAVGETLYVANQYVNTNANGEIIKFDKATGAFEGYLVKHSDRNAPYAPRGIVLSPDGNSIYVASYVSKGDKEQGENPHVHFTPGYISQYNLADGKLIKKYSPPAGFLGVNEFNPRGLVFHGAKLYVSVTDDLFVDNNVGYVLSCTCKPGDNSWTIVVASNKDNNYESGLHRPEGLAFSPDGEQLWVTSFRRLNSDGSIVDPDQLIAYNPTTGAKVDSIPLYQSGQPRAFSQAIVFGPDGKLFVPITNTGELRSYDVSDHTYSVITSAGSPLKAPLYLSFGDTNPSTLDYQ
jgi:DNA-binding beta-propeller fold protein YncE